MTAWDERWKDGRGEQEGEEKEKVDKESGCNAFPQLSFPPIQRAVKRQ